MKVLVVYNSSDPQQVAGAIIYSHKYSDVTYKDICAVTTGDIGTWIGTLSAVYGLLVVNCTVTSAGTGVLSVAQVLLLDAKIAKTAVKTGTASAGASDDTLTQAGAGWTVNALRNMYVKTTGGTGLNQVRKITANSATVLTLESAWTTPISTDTTFTVCATRNEFSHTIAATSGQLKRAWLAFEHETLYPGIAKPLFIQKLAGDKTTNSVAVNAQGVLDEGYITMAAKYFLRDLTDQTVREEWLKILFNLEPVIAGRTKQDMTLYTQMYRYGKRLKESKTAFSES
jgi:hypothetical protein